MTEQIVLRSTLFKHGHVVPRSDGMKARCGGPALCKQCQREHMEQLARVERATYPGYR